VSVVHEAMLEDVLLSIEIIGKRVRYTIDGSKIYEGMDNYYCQFFKLLYVFTLNCKMFLNNVVSKVVKLASQLVDSSEFTCPHTLTELTR